MIVRWVKYSKQIRHCTLWCADGPGRPSGRSRLLPEPPPLPPRPPRLLGPAADGPWLAPDGCEPLAEGCPAPADCGGGGGGGGGGGRWPPCDPDGGRRGGGSDGGGGDWWCVEDPAPAVGAWGGGGGGGGGEESTVAQ
jgi:hypothetical protein